MAFGVHHLLVVEVADLDVRVGLPLLEKVVDIVLDAAEADFVDFVAMGGVDGVDDLHLVGADVLGVDSDVGMEAALAGHEGGYLMERVDCGVLVIDDWRGALGTPKITPPA